MQTKLLNDTGEQRTFAAILETGDEVMTCLRKLAMEENLKAAQVSAIGAFKQAIITYFDWDTKEYQEIPVNDQVEVASLNGDIGVDENGELSVHLHVVLGKRDGSAVAGHLSQAHVRPTLEVILTESPAHLIRYKDHVSGLNLIRF